MQRDQTGRFRYLAMLWAVGSVALAVATFICLQLGLNSATTAFVFLIIIVLLSLLDSFISSAIFSIVAIGCLSFFFVEPLYSFQVAAVEDLTTLAAFLITSLAVTILVRRVRRLSDAQQEKVRLLDLTHDSVLVRDMDDVITYWNRGAQVLYGWKSEEAVGQVAHLLLRTTFPGAHKEIREALLGTGRWEGELLNVKRDGSKVCVSSRWSLQRDDRGVPLGTLETNNDITQRKRTEEALRRTQDTYLAEAQQLSRTGSFGWNVATGEIFWSEESFRIFGYDVQPKAEIDMVLQRVHPEDLALVRAVVDRAISNRQDFDFEHRLLLPDGTVKHLHVVAHAMMDGEPETLQFVGAVMDISVRKRAEEALRHSEQRYRYLFHYMPVALLQFDARRRVELLDRVRAEGVTDLSGYWDQHPDFLPSLMESSSITEVNERAVQMLGARNASALTGSTGSLWRESPATFRRAIESRFRGEPTFQEETKLTTLDGRVIDVLCAISRPEPDSEAGMTLLGLVDITDRVRAQEMLQQVQADFAHTARISVLGELTASIAHEVNQPLAAMTTNGETALRWLNRSEPNVAKAGELLQRVVVDARRAADIIARIRAMAAGRPPQHAPLSLHDVIDDSLLFLRHELQAKGIAISLDLVRSLPRVTGDRTQLQQVVVNLAVNAVQAMAQAGVARRVLLIQTRQPDAQSVCCTFDDSGPGIGAPHLDRLFDSFFTTKDAGMGMGLPISRSIIEAHGGQIRADNKSVHGGARFSFVLPIAATEPH